MLPDAKRLDCESAHYPVCLCTQMYTYVYGINTGVLSLGTHKCANSVDCRHVCVQAYAVTDATHRGTIHIRMWKYVDIHVQTYGRMDVQTYGFADLWTYTHTDIHMYGHTDVQTYGHTDV